MPAQKRHKTKYPGVYYIVGKHVTKDKEEKIYYIYYRKNGKVITEKAGRQFKDAMTPAKASNIRTLRIEGKELSNKEQREKVTQEKEAQNNKWTINKLWNEYKNQKHDYKGLKQDENRYNIYLKEPFGEKEPNELIQLDIDRLRIKLLKTKSPQTVKHILALLRRIINFGTNKSLCSGLGFKIEMPSVNNSRTEDLSPEQLTTLLNVLNKEDNIQVANLMKMALYTGMRRGELFKLRWKDIDFERGFIQIVDPKGGLTQKIPLNESTKNLLENHPKTKSLFVFPGRNGKELNDIIKTANKIRDKAGLPKDFRAFHGLRHAYASMLASSGQVDMYTLQKLLTHKSPAMTQRYAHLRDETLKNASNVANDIIMQSIKKKKDKVVGIIK